MAMFIRVDIDDSIHQDEPLCKRVVEVCPVDIYEYSDGKLGTVEENLDECTLCDLCMIEAPDRVQVVKLYAE